uniref:Porcupine O-acyltransferase like n=1 Tax=Periophthalmus magnuspinnatus TaxID=409849 RepID=A0A3B4AY41_9GOBI
SLKHCISAGAGVSALYLFFQVHAFWVLLLCALSYLLLHLNQRSGSCQMVVAMKVISLAFDLDSGAVSQMPSLPQFLGYVLFVGSAVFGPWTSFSHYMNAVDGKALVSQMPSPAHTSLLKSLLCLVVSSCVAPYLFPAIIPISGGELTDRWVLALTVGRNQWLRAYENAVSFHFSNYFVGHLSEVTSMLAGAGFTQDKEDMRVVIPLHVELPRSLVLVVTSWNIPMSQWLKTYVFKNAMRLGTFSAILVTYTASALLHGLSFHLGAVLLSLGFLTYTEHVLRKKLAAILSGCVLSRPCPSGCSHQHKKDFWVVGLNLCFSFLAVLHLTYLGSMFDPGLMEEEGYAAAHTLQRWSELHWTSHWIVILSWIISHII